ncbi:MAG: PfkB family carbohydrate kinase [Candidatus Aminicenantia bacterium]
MSLVVVGSVALDTIQTPYGKRERVLGGSCIYFALAAGFFTQPRIVGVIGEDFPKGYLESLEKRKIDLEGLKIDSGKTFYWEGIYGEDPDYRETVKTELNVFANFSPVLPESYKKSDLVFLANIDPDLQFDVLSQVDNPKLVAIDSMNLWIQEKFDSLIKVIKKTNILFINEEEAKMLTQKLNIIKAGKELLKMGPSTVILKKGIHGALVFKKNSLLAVPAYPVEEVIDPTGAGDSFAGGFMGYLDRGGRVTYSKFCKALIYGSILASFVIEDFSVNRLMNLTPKEIKKRFQEFKKLTSF